METTAGPENTQQVRPAVVQGPPEDLGVPARGERTGHEAPVCLCRLI